MQDSTIFKDSWQVVELSHEKHFRKELIYETVMQV